MSSAEVAKKTLSKFDFFLCHKFGGRPKNLGGAFVYRQYFRPTGQVWLRFHGWSFIYVDEMKKSAVKYNGLAFGGHKNILHIASRLAALRNCGYCGAVSTALFTHTCLIVFREFVCLESCRLGQPCQAVCLKDLGSHL